MKYDFIADPPGTTFWHAHFHTMTADGLHGPFIVEDKPGSFPFAYDEELVILMTDEYGATSWELEDYLASPDANGNPHADPAPTAGLLCLYDESNKSSVTTSCSRGSSGQGFNLNFTPGKVYRLRIICGSIIAPFIFSIDQHELQLVSADISILDGTTRVNGVPITVSSALGFSSAFWSDALEPRPANGTMSLLRPRPPLSQKNLSGLGQQCNLSVVRFIVLYPCEDPE